VMVGIGTALADDPQLTARHEPVPDAEHQPRRIVLDSLGRLPLDSQLVRAAREIPLTVVVSRAAPRADAAALESHGAEVIVATGEHEPARVLSALEQLGSRGITSLLLVGGPRRAGAFLDAHAIDEIRLFLAPVVLGGRMARAPIEGEGVDQISDALRALSLHCEKVAEDLLISARIHAW
jgi:diaminohydroxyphosphoribosylaminopyrimidine deaminase/5-amino-6-(5-phosphoribosylamino)uracil reductase